MFNEDALSDGGVEPHVMSKRSRSLNPLIYPDWWGYDETEDGEHGNKQKLQRIEIQEERQYKQRRVTKDDNSLDRRL